MNRPDPPVSRDLEHPDPQELHRPIPKIFLVLVAVLLGWAVFYIVKQAPGLESSSASQVQSKDAAAKGARTK